MRQRMSLAARRELITSLTQRYAAAKRVEKRRILDEFTAATNYHRKYAISLLQPSGRARLSRPARESRLISQMRKRH